MGVVDFIAKPFIEHGFIARIHTHLELSRLHQRLEKQALDLKTANTQLEKEVENAGKSRPNWQKRRCGQRLLIDQSSDGIVILDNEGRVYEANLQSARMMGYSLEEMRQLRIWDWDCQIPQEQLLEMLRSDDQNGHHLETSEQA